MKLSNKQKQELKKTAVKYGLKLIILFGSFVSGASKADSDFDVAILGRDKSINDKIFALIGSLSQALSRDIDLSIINSADPLLKYEIARNCILLYGRQTDFIDFKARAILEYMDNRPFFINEHKYIIKTIKNL